MTKAAPWSIDFWTPVPPPEDGLDPRAWRWPDAVRWGRVRLFALTGIAYVLGSIPAQILIRESGLSAVFFIPAGISVAFLLRTSRRHWWVVLAAVACSEVVMDVPVGYPPAQIAGFVAANVLEPLVGASIVHRWCGSVDLARLRHVFWFALGAVVLATAVGAAVGSLPVYLMGDAEFSAMFLQWWLGDAVGVILVGTAILAWGSSPDRRTFFSWGGLFLLATSIVTIVVILRSELPLTFLVLIGVVLAGALYGVRAVAVTGLAIAVVFALDLAFRSGVLIVGIPDTTALLIIKLRLGVFTLAGLVVAAEAFEGRSAIEQAAEEKERSERLFAQAGFERQVAIRMQRALLPKIPELHPELTVAVRYEAGSDGLLVGGDWYDIFSLPRNRIGFTVGDVVGNGLDASAAMSRMRTAVRVLALNTESPGELLNRLDQFSSGEKVTEFATALYAILDLETGNLVYASAGHPPILVVTPDGSTTWLDEGLSPPLYGGHPEGRTEAVTTLMAGNLLLCYTDGLVERRGESVDVGLRRLEKAASALSTSSPAKVCDRLIEQMGIGPATTDDVVVVALKLDSSHRSESLLPDRRAKSHT